MYGCRWNYAKIQYIENHLSQTVQIPFSQMVHRSWEANAACCKVLLAFTVLPATFTIEQSKPLGPLTTVYTSACSTIRIGIWTMTAISVQHCSFVLYSHLGVDTEAERDGQ